MNNYDRKIDENTVNITNDTYLEYNEGYVDSSKLDRKQRTILHTSKNHSGKNFETQKYDFTR